MDGSAKTPAAVRLEQGEAGERLTLRGAEGSGEVCVMRTLKSTSSGLRFWEDCLARTALCSLRGILGTWLWSLGVGAGWWEMRSDKDGVTENPGGRGRGGLAGGVGKGRLLRPVLLCWVLVVFVLLSGFVESAEKFCRPGSELKRSGLLLLCSWISSANEGLPPWPPTPGLLLTPPTSTALLACQRLLRLPSGTGNDPTTLGSCRDRLLREQDRRLDVGLTEVRLLRLGVTPRPLEGEIPGFRPRLIEIFGPWAGLACLCLCSAISWAREPAPAATQEFEVKLSFTKQETRSQPFASFDSVRTKRLLRLYKSPDPGWGCVRFEVTRVTLSALCGVERDKAPYLTRANRMQREPTWRGRGGGEEGDFARHHKQPYDG